MNSGTDTLKPKTERPDRARAIDIVRAGLARRYARERRFRFLGLVAVVASFVFVGLLFISIIATGYQAIWQTRIRIAVNLDPEIIDPEGNRDPAALSAADYGGLIKSALFEMFPAVTARADKRALTDLVSSGAAFEVRQKVIEDPKLIGTEQGVWVTANDTVDMLMKGHAEGNAEGGAAGLQAKQVAWIDEMIRKGWIEKRFNSTFFTAGDSREPELSGIWSATVGSFYTLLVTLLLAFPIGVAGAIYLEEFARKGRWTDVIEVNINNLAAVPSIIFGLLGLAVFIGFVGLPRSSPLVGGIVLGLMTLPVIIVASRAALKAVPPSIRDGALGVGASKVQTVFHHVVPLALPGMLTGAIIGMARALGETAPLLMIGMVAFIADTPGGIMDPATGLPVQIYLWADSPERAFMERTSAAIMVLLVFMVLMNSVAIVLRKRFERRW
ncbi:MAG: phosphate ABC transporter permease PstA [Gammaproteobacteria bacterium]